MITQQSKDNTTSKFKINYKKRYNNTPLNHNNNNNNKKTKTNHSPDTDLNHNPLRFIRNDEDLYILNTINNLPINNTHFNTENPDFIDYFKIGTINIRQKFEKSKFTILNFMSTHNYDILGITETGHIRNLYNNKKCKYNIKNIDNEDITYTVYFDTDGTTTSEGTAIIVNEEVEKHIYEVKNFKGRAIYLEYLFKDHKCLKIFNIYLPANNVEPTEKKKNEDINNFIKENINKKNFNKNSNNNHIIVMGDFNIDPDKVQQNKNIIPKEKRLILDTLKEYHLIDTAKVFSEKPSATWSKPNSNNIISRIDLIYMTKNLLNETISTYTTIPLKMEIDTDHKAINSLIDRNYLISKKKNKLDMSNKRMNNVNSFNYNYKKVDDEMWKEFSKSIEQKINKKNYLLNIIDNNMLLNASQTETIWNDLQDLITSTKKTLNFPKKKISRDTKNDKCLQLPKHLKQISSELLQLSEILKHFTENKYRKFINSQISNGAHISEENKDIFFGEYWMIWSLHRYTLEKITSQHADLKNFKDILIHPAITPSNKKNIKKHIIRLQKTLQLIFDTNLKQHQIEQINFYINRRNLDITENQTRMINSILDRRMTKISLDKIKFVNENGDIIYTKNPALIQKQCIEHFQCLGSSLEEINNTKNFETIQDLPLDWQNIYECKISEQHKQEMEQTGAPITFEELQETINILPNGKAPGVSKITNEDIKHMSLKMIKLLLIIFNSILQHQTLPKNWNKAFIYPIPKQAEFDGFLGNTRPITLLETPRKLFVTIISKRLNKTLSNVNILQYNNRAGLLGEATFQPLQFLKHITEHHRIYNKELWVSIQDLSKAYDRVNVSLLKLALRRINIPPHLIEILCNLFTNRYNQIILHHEVSAEYKILQGIDQGEVVSPLLWIIYYDPMFERINNDPKLNIKLSVPKIININNPDSDLEIILYIAVLAYLDDTTWFASSPQQLEEQLKVANDFYTMANIKINHEKYKVLCNNKLMCNKNITLTINNEEKTITTKIAGKNQGYRILGIYYNAFNSYLPTVKKIRNTVAMFYKTMCKKHITHEQVIYIINKVLVPKIEYLNQNSILSFNQCSKLFNPIKKLFKHKFHLPKSINDNIIYNPLIEHINNFYNNQLSSHAAFTTILLNNKHLETIAHQQMLTLQNAYWTKNFPTPKQIQRNIKSFNTHLTEILFHLQKINITFSPLINLEILGGTLDITDHIYDLKKSDIISLKKKRILFYDQILTLDGLYLKTFEQIKYETKTFTPSLYSKFKGKKPNWFFKIEEHMTINNNNRSLINPITEPLKQNLNIISPRPAFKQGEYIIKPRNNNWTHFWNARINDIIIGKIKEHIRNPGGTNTSIIQHYIRYTHESEAQRLTPRKQTTFLQPCKGCTLSEPYIHTVNKSTCHITSVTNDLIHFKIHKSKEERNIKNNIARNINKNIKIATTPYHTLRTLSYNAYRKRYNPDQQQNNFGIHDENTHKHTTRNHNLNPNHPWYLDIIIQGNPDFNYNIKELAKRHIEYETIKCYTDGSLVFSENQTVTTTMGFGGIITNSKETLNTFKGNTCCTPSSTKAEGYAILTAVIITPNKAVLDLYTDSQNAIFNINTFLHNKVSDRKKLNITNHILWHSIAYLIRTKNINIKLNKVKGHNNDKYNDEADKLAKEGNDLESIMLISPKFSSHYKAIPSWNNTIPLDLNIRKLTKSLLNYRTFCSSLQNQKFKSVNTQLMNQEADWRMTQKWLKFKNNKDQACSPENTKYISYKIKCWSQTLPTLAKQMTYYPSLYNNKSNLCVKCNLKEDSQDHLWFCDEHITELNNTITVFKKKLLILIHKHSKDANIRDIKRDIDKLNCFQPITSHNNNSSHHLYNWLNQIIPKEFTNLLARYIKKKKTRTKYILEFTSDFLHTCRNIVWLSYTDKLDDWHKRHNIKKTDKKFCARNKEKTRRNNRDSRTNKTMRQHNYIVDSTHKRQSTQNDNMWLILASSNFLHAGNWLANIEDLYVKLNNAVLNNNNLYYFSIETSNRHLVTNPFQRYTKMNPHLITNNNKYRVLVNRNVNFPSGGWLVGDTR
jgi:ribonuclease HI